MNKLLGKTVSFVPHTLYDKSGRSLEYTCSVRGTVDHVSKNGWFRVKYYASDGSVQYECFKEADIVEKVVTLVGRSKVDKTRNWSAR